MKKAVALMAIVLTLGSTLALDAEAKRLGGGKSGGMQRQNVTAPASPTATPGTPATTAPVAGSTAAAAAPGAAAAAAAPKRSWMGPVAGLAAGLGIAALASHFGFGEALANMLTIALVAFAVLAVIGFFLRKRMQAQGQALAGAGAGAGAAPNAPAAFRTNEALPPQQGGSLIGSRLGGGVAPVAATGTIPAGFDVAAFERNARDQFMGLQAANDAADLQRLRDYLTPEMYELAVEEVQERAGATQKTEVFGLHAQVLDVAEEADRYVVSVRFTGSVRDQHGAVPEDLDETWHLVKPRAGFGGWLVAGIQQNGA